MEGYCYKYYFVIEPVAKQRARVTKKGHAYTPAKTKAFEKKIKVMAIEQHGLLYLEGPLEVSMHFYFTRPKSVLRETPCIRPDIDNCIKAVGDALNGVCWSDDSQIIMINAIKLYSAISFGYIELEVREVT